MMSIRIDPCLFINIGIYKQKCIKCVQLSMYALPPTAHSSANVATISKHVHTFKHLHNIPLNVRIRLPTFSLL